MLRAAAAFLDQFAPSETGVLGLSWGSTRAEVWARLPEPAKRVTNGLGARFFSTTRVFVDTVPTVLHFQFWDGLNSVKITPLRSLRLRDACVSRFGSPPSVHGSDVLRVTEWRGDRGSIRLIERAGIPDTLHFGRLGDAVADPPYQRTGFPELEDLLPRQDEIQRLINVGKPGEAGALAGRRRLLSGYCPACGQVIGSTHFPSCSVKPRDDTCPDCRTSRAEYGNLCLPCAQRQRIQASLRETS
jgi:hypothetical protein